MADEGCRCTLLPSARRQRARLLTTGIIFDVKKYSIHDGPGIRTTVFLKGCPLHCSWCHNPEGQDQRPQLLYRPDRCLGCGECVEVCPEGAIRRDGQGVTTDSETCSLCGACVEVCYAEARQMVGRQVTVSEVLAEVERDIPFYDQSGGGVTVSGGEPLLQPEFLLGLLQACKERGMHTAVDTCGHSDWQPLDSIREYVDLFLYDLKLVDDEKHRSFTGVSNQSSLRNLRALSQHGENIILRVPVIPGANDDEENLRATAKLAAALPSLARMDLLPYHNTAIHKYRRLGREYSLPGAERPSDDLLTTIAQTLRDYGLQVQIGG
jgi:pyruvate formate lyase activating enzyme